MIGVKTFEHNREEQKEKEHARMVEIVKENKGLVDDFIKTGDNYHQIKSVEINYNDLEINPMSGIDISAYVNNDKSLYFTTVIDKNGKDFITGGGVISEKLDNLLNTKPKRHESK